MVVCGADGVSRSVGELKFDMVVVESLLAKDCRSESTEAVAGHLTFEAHSFKRAEDRRSSREAAAMALLIRSGEFFRTI